MSSRKKVWLGWRRSSLEPPGHRQCWDEPVRIAVRGLAPEQPVTLRASLRDEKGALEPDKPFWRFLKRDVRTPFVVELEVLDGHEPEAGRLLGRAVHERHFLRPGVRREPVRAGRVRASPFLPPGEGPFPGIIDLFGSGDGLCVCRASLLVEHGFAVLALAYFRFEDLPEYLKDMHVEYFEEAVDFMLQHPKGIIDTVLINACVANTMLPLHYMDVIIPGLSHDPGKGKITKSGVLKLMDVWNNPLEEPNHQSLILLEKDEGPFLFIVGIDDHTWKSEFYTYIASEWLQAHGKDRPQIICYPETGHCVDLPYFLPSRASVHAVFGKVVSYGAVPRAHSRAQVNDWQQIQIFFHKQLSGKKPVKHIKA
ncbi:PREDICTED: acyl-coenzyme A thioesterase 6-like [Galeopterus variegatus]|uniref:Acyl-coenzyme A thioesterase 6-like n=1 Tax=Galeopterus variegatus TaxID=482537 RepID=A0ABM0RNX9_GALVR|nr:PREDICTED: acyl-coenzyme A thioesterase 6-like [Galeopterus variegatus]